MTNNIEIENLGLFQCPSNQYDEYTLIEYITQNFTEIDIQNFIKVLNEIDSHLKISNFSPQKLPDEIKSSTKISGVSIIVKKLKHVSKNADRLTFEIRMFVDGHIRIIFSFDNDISCNKSFYTYCFKKEITNKQSDKTDELGNYSSTMLIDFTNDTLDTYEFFRTL